MATVETRDIRKLFGDVKAVDGVDLLVKEGEFLVFLGPSGCGKTTLLRMIAGLETQTSGDILIGGQVVNDLPPRARKIAMVFQSYALYPHMTVYRNIAFPLKAQGFPGDQIPQKVEWAASTFGIVGFGCTSSKRSIVSPLSRGITTRTRSGTGVPCTSR